MVEQRNESSAPPPIKVTLQELSQRICSLLETRGFQKEEIEAISQYSTRSTAEGYLAHGLGALWTLERLGELRPAKSLPVVEWLGERHVEVEASGALGYLAAKLAVDCLCAEPDAPAVATVRSRGYRGRLGHLVRPLAARGLAAIAVQGTPAVVRSERSWGPVVGTNPIAIGAPELSGNPIIADLTTASESWADWYLHRYLEDSSDLQRREEPDLQPFGEMRGLALSIGLQAMVHAMLGTDLMIKEAWGLAIIVLPVSRSLGGDALAEWTGRLNLRALPGQRSEERYQRATKQGVWIPEKLWRWARRQNRKP